jgi:peptidoglycan hydrolase-like protein with peptidoglycan-binding domain
MSFYRAQPGESPAMIARKLNTSVGALMFANRHKPTTVVAGKRTWQGVGIGELLHVPRAGAGALGDPGMLGAVIPAAPNAPHAMIRQGSSGADVALWQTIIGVTADGAFGPKTAAATRTWQSTHGLVADGIVGPKTWAAAVGAGAPVTVATPTVTPPPMASPPSGLASVARTALTALSSDPNYCTNVAKTGTAVNTAVHNFKAAWNSANPSRAVPIGTGKYEVSVAAALWSALGGTVDVPPGCGAVGAPATPPPTPISAPQAPPPPSAVPSMPSPAASAPTPSAPGVNVPAAVQALTSIDPCDQGYAALVSQAQSALGVTVDGKYGSATAAAARRLVPNAPAGCSPRPAWWTPPGHSNAPGGSAPAPSAPSAPVPQAPIQQAPPAGSPSTGGGTSVTLPEAKKKLSTGAIVAGAVGAAALVGLLAATAMGKKPGHRGARGARGPSRRKSSGHKSKRKSSKRKKR